MTRRLPPKLTAVAVLIIGSVRNPPDWIAFAVPSGCQIADSCDEVKSSKNEDTLLPALTGARATSDNRATRRKNLFPIMIQSRYLRSEGYSRGSRKMLLRIPIG